MGIRVDLHTHSVGSSDGGLTTEDYRQALEQGKLDYIAITDHGTIEMAQQIRDGLGELGERIIVGEEIKTTDGELIGLYLSHRISHGLSPEQTIKAIREQGGIVYVPHPFETVRSGISEKGLLKIINDVDIIEIYNSRALFQLKSKKAIALAKRYGLRQAASSDAHGLVGWCKTYTLLDSAPKRDSIVKLLEKARYIKKTAGLGILYPKLNRKIKKR